MTICPKCHQQLPDDAKFCGNCAAPLPQTAAAQPNSDPFVGKCIDNKYFIKQRIACGGMGVVYLAIQKGVGQEVAIKKLHSELYRDQEIVGRFINEARAYGKITHPNAVKLHDLLNVNGEICIIMEFVHGKTLTHFLENGYNFSIRQIIDISLQLADALGTVHRANIIHRDLKTENVMLMETVSGRFSVKILDFGIAKMLDQSVPKQTMKGAIVGTPDFMSPEQCFGDRVDHRTDIYSFGILMFAMICGKLPFSAETAVGMFHKQLNEPTPRCIRPDGSEVPRDLESIVDKCMMKQPSERYQGFSEVIADLTDLQEGLKASSMISAIDPVLPVSAASPSASTDQKPIQLQTASLVQENDVPGTENSPTQGDSHASAALQSEAPHHSVSGFSIADQSDDEISLTLDNEDLSLDELPAVSEQEDDSEKEFSEDGEYSLGDIQDIDESLSSSSPDRTSKAPLAIAAIIAIIAAAAVFLFLHSSEKAPAGQEPAVAEQPSAPEPEDSPQAPAVEKLAGSDIQNEPEPEPIIEKEPDPIEPSQVNSRSNIERGVYRAAMKRIQTQLTEGEIDEPTALIAWLDPKSSSLTGTDAENYDALKKRQIQFKDIMDQAAKAKKHQNCDAIRSLADSIPEDAPGMKSKLDALAQKCGAYMAAPPTSL